METKSPIKTQTWTERSRKREIKDATFDGCTLGLRGVSTLEYPVSLEFSVLEAGESFSKRQRSVYLMSMEQAERVYRALGDMIERRKEQIANGVWKKEGA